MCNHRVDCPGGLEERQCNEQRCTVGQLRCSNSAMCVALDNICDDVDDCPLQEDEYFCDIFPAKCPFGCTCLLFAIECNGWQPVETTKHELQARYTFPYVKISIRNANVSDVLLFSRFFHQAVEMKLHNCYIFEICLDWEQLAGRLFLRNLSFAFNKITTISRHCFPEIPLRFLDLSFNAIAYIMKFSFATLEQLQILDLSSNRMTHLYPYTFSQKVSLKLLDLRRNFIIDIFTDFFNVIKISIILTESYKVCCINVKLNTVCEARPNWPNSCGNLLHDITSKVLIWLVAMIGLFLNFTAVFVLRRKSKQNNYNSMVTGLAFGDTSFCLYLLSIAISDVIFHGRYMENETRWRQSLICFDSCLLFLYSNFMSIFSIHLLSISRYCIVKDSLNSRFLERNFILRLRFFGLSFTVSTSLCLVLLQKYYSNNSSMPTGLCLLIGNIDKSIIPSLVTWIFIFSQGIPIVSIPLINGLLIYEKIRWDKQVKEMVETSSKNNSKSIIIRLVLVSTSNLVCWIASTILLFLTIIWERYPFSVLVWTTIIVMPLNTLVNPFLFVFSTKLTNVCKNTLR